MIVTLAKATEARDELVNQLGFERGPEKTGVVGIGIGRAASGYCVTVDVMDNHLDVPTDVRGVPVRVFLSTIPKAYAGPAAEAGPHKGRRKLRRLDPGIDGKRKGPRRG